jgi:hypothetical protein
MTGLMNLLQEIKEDYDLCIQSPEKYVRRVELISDMFHLRRKERLKGDKCPVYVIGNYEKATIIMFGINPAYTLLNSPYEDGEARKSWDHYRNLYLNFFQFYSNEEYESPYYTALLYFISGLVGKDFSKLNKWELFNTYLAIIELIPYHSEGISLPLNLSNSQFNYLKGRYDRSLEFMAKFNPKLFVFSGQIWSTLLIKSNIIQQYDSVPISEKLKMYFFELYDIPCVLFDKFFVAPFWGITNYDRNVTIPKRIHNKFENLLPTLSRSNI